MAEKISYRAVPIETLTSALLAAMLLGASKLIVATDVAKLTSTTFGGSSRTAMCPANRAKSDSGFTLR
jgi:hypothetical protein